VNDYRRASGEVGACLDSSAGDSAGRSCLVPTRGYRTNWGRELSSAPSVDIDRTLTLPRPDTGASDLDNVSPLSSSGRGRRTNERAPRIAVLGCGPAGLLAAHAIRLHGFRPDILSYKRKSQMSGAIYLHEAIPYLTSDVRSATITYEKLGSRDGYAEKVYGHPEAPCSWDKFEGSFQAYSMQQAYQLLWIKYEHMIREHIFGSASPVASVTENYDIVINTIPATTFCRYPDLHDFLFQEMWVNDDDPWEVSVPENTIMYNGSLEDYWYRASNIFGFHSVETTQEPADISWKKGVKPIENNCDCNPRFHRVGRFGLWKKGILAHQAFRGAIEALEAHGVVDALF
jgi:hypothetical protein